MNYSSIVFDWDGVLGKTLHLWLEAYRHELKNLGFSYSDKVIVEDFFYEHDKASIKYPDINFDSFAKSVHDYMVSHISSLKTYEGASELLEDLRKNNIDFALASSSPRRLLKAALDETGLAGHFSAIVAGDEVMKHKPDPEPFLNAIEIANFSKENTLILGDSYTDIIAAKSAGIDCCLFLPQENKIFYDFDKLKATNPTYCVGTLREFKDLILFGKKSKETK